MTTLSETVKTKFKKIFVEDKGKILIKRTPVEAVKALIERLFLVHTDKGLIRVGAKGDGGYLIPDDTSGIKACFSPGVGRVSAFEKDCFNLGMKIFLADKTVDKPVLDIDPNSYAFIKKYVGCTDNPDFMTLDSWVDSYELGEGDLLLQMDIEGGEYPTIINVSNALLKRFRILIIEFHYLDELWNPAFFQGARLAFNKILETHTCVHIHPNNCRGVETKFGLDIPRFAEFTFLRNDRITHREFAKAFPHELDFDNTSQPHIELPKSWYKHS